MFEEPEFKCTPPEETMIRSPERDWFAEKASVARKTCRHNKTTETINLVWLVLVSMDWQTSMNFWER